MNEDQTIPTEEIQNVNGVAEVQTDNVEQEAVETNVNETNQDQTNEVNSSDQSTQSDEDHNRNGYEKRKKYSDMKNENAYLKQHINQLALAQTAPVQQAQTQAPVQNYRDPNVAPKVEDYEDTDTYIQEQVKFQTQKIINQQNQHNQQATVQSRYKERAETYAKANKSFAEDMEYTDSPVSNIIEDSIMKSEQGPAIAHLLAKDPKLAQRLYYAEPLEAIREFVRLEEQTAKKKPVVSSAPAPVDSPKSKSPQQSANLSTLSMDEYMKVMNGLM